MSNYGVPQESCKSSHARVSSNNDKPCFTAKLRQIRLQKELAFWAGNSDSFKGVRYRFSKGRGGELNDCTLRNYNSSLPRILPLCGDDFCAPAHQVTRFERRGLTSAKTDLIFQSCRQVDGQFQATTNKKGSTQTLLSDYPPSCQISRKQVLSRGWE